jgi:hypothetical protein
VVHADIGGPSRQTAPSSSFAATITPPIRTAPGAALARARVPGIRAVLSKDRLATIPGGQPGLHYLCPGYKAFFGHIRPAMDAMCELLRAGRAPSELVRWYTAADARRGRNDPCPCGSGRKWKRCHSGPVGENDQPP